MFFEPCDEPVMIPIPNTGGPSGFGLSPETVARQLKCLTIEGAVECRKEDDRFQDCKDIVRDLYKRPQGAPHYTPEQLKKLYDSMQHLQVYRNNGESKVEIPPPFTTFDEAFHDNPTILRELIKHKYTKPTPIQSQLWPTLLKGNDCIGVSQTGSGKTLGFILPAFLHIDAQSRLYRDDEKKPSPFVLVLTPTRELAQQITRETKKFSYNGYKCVCVYGGAARRDQINACRHGVEIVVATPGRLADLADEGAISLATVSYLVLDEADRMLDLGFEPSIRRILCEIRPDRIVALTSATWPESVRKLVKKYTKDAVMVVVGSLNLSACTSVKQYFEFWEGAQKFERLREIARFLHITHGNRFKMIVFVKSKAMVDFLAVKLGDVGVSAEPMHGGMSQLARENVFHFLRTGKCQILVATDVVSRGIDIPDVTHILNYDFPGNIEEYVHRVGRTGRAGRTGEAMTFISWHDRVHAAGLISILETSQQFADAVGDGLGEVQIYGFPPHIDTHFINYAAGTASKLNEVPNKLRHMAARHAEMQAKQKARPPRSSNRDRWSKFVLYC